MTIGLPFITKDPPTIWVANLVLLIGCYAGSLAMGEGDPEAEAAGPPVETVPPPLPGQRVVSASGGPHGSARSSGPSAQPEHRGRSRSPELAFSRPQN